VLSVHEEEAEVQLGIMRVNVPLTDLEPASAAEVEEQTDSTESVTSSSTAQRLAAGKAQRFSDELHLRGMTVEEAVQRLDKYLDDAFLTGQKQVRVVHGKGKGVLRRAVHDYLSTHPNVADYRLAPRAEGGHGATIIVLEEAQV
jgi:DNA mismatch repair protein MutS2